MRIRLGNGWKSQFLSGKLPFVLLTSSAFSTPPDTFHVFTLLITSQAPFLNGEQFWFLTLIYQLNRLFKYCLDVSEFKRIPEHKAFLFKLLKLQNENEQKIFVWISIFKQVVNNSGTDMFFFLFCLHFIKLDNKIIRLIITFRQF